LVSSKQHPPIPPICRSETNKAHTAATRALSHEALTLSEQRPQMPQRKHSQAYRKPLSVTSQRPPSLLYRRSSTYEPSTLQRSKLAFTQYCHCQYSMLNGKTGVPGGNHILGNIDRNIQSGGGGCNKRGVECQE